MEVRPQKAPSTEGAKGFRVCGRGISPLRRRGGGRRPSASFPIAPVTPSVRSLCNLSVLQRRQVAAALSAAVTTTQQQETALTLRRNQAKRKVPRQTPAALRERGVWGERRFSQRSGLSPQNLSFVPAVSSEGSAREGASLQRSPLPRNHLEYTPVNTSLM